jgi:hypothetical protein
MRYLCILITLIAIAGCDLELKPDDPIGLVFVSQAHVNSVNIKNMCSLDELPYDQPAEYCSRVTAIANCCTWHYRDHNSECYYSWCMWKDACVWEHNETECFY